MKQRELEFRAWNIIVKKFEYFTLPDLEKQKSAIQWHIIDVTQFIGRLDKNNKKIFEGDIVKYSVKRRFCKNPECEQKHELGIDRFCPRCGNPVTDDDFITIARVVYDQAAFGYRKENKNDQQWPVYANEIYVAWVEVIGNVYQNPELLLDEN